MRHREPAICLSAIDYSETSQVVHLLTRGCGIVHLIAKGSKRPKSISGGAIDLLSEADVVFSTSSRDSLGTLIEFVETTIHQALLNDRQRLNTAMYMIELAREMLAEADPHPEIFDLLHSALVRLAQDDAPVVAVLAYYQWRLLRYVGLLGNLTDCVACGQPVRGKKSNDVYFSSLQGGLLCDACEGAVTEKFRLEAAALAAMATMKAAEAGKKVHLGEKQAMALSRMLAYHSTQQLGKRLKMHRHVIGKSQESAEDATLQDAT